MLLRFPQQVGKARYKFHPPVHALLLNTALQSARIEIRGRTDAERGNPINQDWRSGGPATCMDC